MRRNVAVALVAALALGLAGCGGSERTEIVSKAQAVKRLEAACRAGTLEAQKVFRSGSERAVAVKAIRTNLETIIARIGNLETSGAAKADLDVYKDSVRTRLDVLARVAAAAAADQQKALVAERPVIEAAEAKGFAAIRRLGARHVCI